MKPKSPSQTPVYFATIKEPQRYVHACLEKITEWRDYCSNRGLAGLWTRKLANYYGMSEDAYCSQVVTSGGTEGELTNFKVNDLSKLIQDQLVVITSARPAGVAKAINSDVRSLRNSRIGTAIAEYYMTQVGFEQHFVAACEIALVIDEAYLDLMWDKSSGDPIRPDVDQSGKPIPGKMLMSGDAKLRVHAPFNVARDPSLPVKSQRWNIISILCNRFDLAAMHPEFENQILTAAQDNCKQIKLQERKTDDNVYLHLVVHDRTPAVPEGRYSFIVGDTLIADMPLPFPEYPIDRLSPGDVIDGPTGYCKSNDIMAMEQITDALHSTIATNNINFGGQNIVGPPLAGITVSELAKGSRYFEVPPDMVDKIKPLQLTQSAGETFNYIKELDGKKQGQLGSVGGTIQQQAQQGASGSSMALVQAQAVQYNSPTQRSYFGTMSRTMTKLIGVLRVYADTPRVARIVGKIKSQGLKEFKYTGKDLSSISSIIYEMVNPVSQTIGGRMEMAKDLITNKMITSPRQYLTVVETGNLDALTGPDEDINLLILEENELLSEGKPVQAVITENHQDHIKAHMSVIASPSAKEDPNVVDNVLGHIQEHIDLWQQASIENPTLLLATGQQPLPQPAPMMPPGGPEGGPAPEMGAGGPPVQDPNAGLEGNQPSMPQMPVNPATGERAEVPGATV